MRRKNLLDTLSKYSLNIVRKLNYKRVITGFPVHVLLEGSYKSAIEESYRGCGEDVNLDEIDLPGRRGIREIRDCDTDVDLVLFGGRIDRDKIYGLNNSYFLKDEIVREISKENDGIAFDIHVYDPATLERAATSFYHEGRIGKLSMADFLYFVLRDPILLLTSDRRENDAMINETLNGLLAFANREGLSLHYGAD